MSYAVVIASVGLVILAGLTIFQLTLIFGKPLGEFAWGGNHKILPKRLRFASIFSIILYIVFAAFLVSGAGFMGIMPHSPVLNIGLWMLSCYFILGVIMNAISKSKKERAVMTPVAFLLAVIFLIVAIEQ